MPKTGKAIQPSKSKDLRIRSGEIPPVPALADPAWDAAIRKIRSFPSVHPDHQAAAEIFQGNWEALAWFIAVDQGLIKPPRSVGAAMKGVSSIGTVFSVILTLCEKCFGASRFGGSNYESPQDWLAAILYELKIHGWQSLLSQKGARPIADNNRLIYKSLAAIPIENPFGLQSPHFYNLIEVCRYKATREPGFPVLWDKFLRSFRTLNKEMSLSKAIVAINGKAFVPAGSGKGVIALP